MLNKSHLLLLPLAAALVAWFFLLRPAFLGGPASYIMVAGRSMEPTLHTGDLALTQKQYSYNIGDIVAFHVPKGEPAEGAMVIHRIVGGSAAEGYVVQGDNKSAPDPWRPKPQDIVGQMWLRVPGGGHVFANLRQPLPLGALAGAFGALSVLTAGRGRRGRRSGASPPRAAPAAPAKTPPAGSAAPAKAPPAGSTAVTRSLVPSRPPSRRGLRRELAQALETGAQAICVAVAVAALAAATTDRARAMAKPLGRHSGRTERASVRGSHVTAPAATLAEGTLPSQPTPRRALWWALALAGLAGAQAVGVAVAVLSLWAAGSISFADSSGRCPNEPAAPTTDVGPGPGVAFDASSLICMAPLAAPVAVQGDGSPQAPAVPPQESPAPAQATPVPVQAAAVLPEPSPVPPQAPPPPAPSPPEVTTFDYVVQPGETLWQVAVRFGTTVERLADLNSLADSRLIYYGQKLKVPQ